LTFATLRFFLTQTAVEHHEEVNNGHYANKNTIIIDFEDDHNRDKGNHTKSQVSQSFVDYPQTSFCNEKRNEIRHHHRKESTPFDLYVKECT